MSFTAVLAAVAALALTLTPTRQPPGSTATHAPTRVSLQAQLAIARGAGDVLPAYWVHRNGAAFTARNAGQALTERFARGGVTIATRQGSVGLSATALGRRDHSQTLATTTPRATHNRVSYSRPGIAEWYANGPLGLEQGFTLTRRPTGTGAVSLKLRLSGSLGPRLADNHQTITLLGRGSRPILRYSGLSVTDASGRHLKAWLTLTGRTLSLRFHDAGARYPVRIDPYIQDAKLTAGTTLEEVGWSLAVSGDTIAAGAPLYPGDGTKVGAVYVFTRPQSGWADTNSPTARLTDTVSGTLDHLGQSVGISGDTIVAGAHGNGYVDIWVKPSSGGWASTSTPTATLTDSQISGNTGFGTAVAISGDTVVVGDPAGGFAYVYVKPAAGWANATVPDATLQDNPGTVYFGSSVAVSGDTIVVGDPANTGNAGAAFVFQMPGGGWGTTNATLNQTAKLSPSGNPASIAMGTSLAIDGTTIVAGAPYWKNASSTQVGAAYVFTEPVSGWVDATQNAILTASDGITGDEFGWSVGVSGTTIAVGDPQGYVTNGQGAVYLFQKPSGGWVDATEDQKLTAADTATNLDLGYAVAIDGGTVAGSADTSQNGRVYVFAPATPTISTASLPGATVGSPYSGTVDASGGTPPYTWSAAGLPSGLSIAPSSGQITGTPAAAGSYTPTITVTDALNQSDSRQLALSVTQPSGGGGGGGGGSGSGFTASLIDQTPGATLGHRITLIAGSTLPSGQSASGYSYLIGGSGGAQATCPGYDPSLAITATQPGTTTATVTVTSSAGTQATASVPVALATASLPSVQLAHLARAPSTRRPRVTAGTSLGPLGVIAMVCQPAAGPSGPASTIPKLQPSQLPGVQLPLGTSAAVPPGCTGPNNQVVVGILDALGCFQQVSIGQLDAPERALLCTHVKAIIAVSCSSLSGLLSAGALAVAGAAGGPGTTLGQRRARITPTDGSALFYDQIWVSRTPISVDGLEIDPINGSEIVLALAGTEQTSFAKDTAFFIASDAMVRVGGLPITLQVPDYSKLYQQGTSLSGCSQATAQALTSGDLSSADCLGSLTVPSLTDLINALKLPNLHGPINLGVGPRDLGIELGSFEIPTDVLPLPILPKLPLSGKIQVNLTGAGSASVAVHVVLPILQDGAGNGLTGDTTLSIDIANGLQIDNLDIKIPSLAELGLARLRNLEFIYKQPSYYEGQGTIDLSDVINGNVRVHVIFDNGSFQQGDVHFFSGAGDGYPLFGPLFLTQLDAAVAVNPDTQVSGHALVSIGPAATDNGCGLMGIDGTATMNFGNPWTLDAVAQSSLLCKPLGQGYVFHADSNGNFGYAEFFSYPIADFASVSGSLGGSAYLNTNTGQLDFQIDGGVNVSGTLHLCAGVCVDQSFKAGADATLALGLHSGSLVGGTGLCLHLSTPIGGFDVGAGVDDLPTALLAASAYDVPAVLSRLDILTSGCNVSRWQLIATQSIPASARGHADASTTVEIPAGESTALIGLQGAGGAPSVTLSGPGGRQISAPTAQSGITVTKDALIIRQPSTGHTLVEIPHPAAGKWTVTPDAGSAPLQSIETAHTLPAPHIVATVGGRGLRRVLSYRITREPGLAVRFFEAVDRGQHPIGVARRNRGAIRFTPGIGSSRRRSIVAHMTLNGMPLRSMVVAKYMPGRFRPGRPSHIRVRRAGHSWQISWRPAKLATIQMLTIRFVNGVQALVDARGTQRSLNLGTLAGGAQPAAIAVVGLRGGVRGPRATAYAPIMKRRHRR